MCKKNTCLFLLVTLVWLYRAYRVNKQKHSTPLMVISDWIDFCFATAVYLQRHSVAALAYVHVLTSVSVVSFQGFVEEPFQLL